MSQPFRVNGFDNITSNNDHIVGLPITANYAEYRWRCDKNRMIVPLNASASLILFAADQLPSPKGYSNDLTGLAPSDGHIALYTMAVKTRAMGKVILYLDDELEK